MNPTSIILTIIASVAMLLSFFLPFYHVPLLSFFTEVSGLNIIKNIRWLKEIDFRIVVFLLGPVIVFIEGIISIATLASKEIYPNPFSLLYYLFVFGYAWYSFEEWNAVFSFAEVGFYLGLGAIVLNFVAQDKNEQT